VNKVFKFLNRLEDNVCGIILLVMAILAFINVIARYIFLASMPWVEELNRLGLVILTYVGAAVALKNHSHLGLSIVTERLSPKWQKIVAVIGCAVGVFVCYIGIKYGFRMVASEYKNNVLTQGMQWPEYLYGMWLPIGCIILAIRFVQDAVYTILGKEFDKE